jgi:addiction module RelE/StbE family toxin
MDLNKYTIVFTNKAKQDIKKIVNYVSINLMEPKVAKEYKELFIKEIESLCELPNRNAQTKGKVPKDLTRRKAFVKNYIVFYLVDDSNRNVIIERVLYGASNWTKNY